MLDSRCGFAGEDNQEATGRKTTGDGMGVLREFVISGVVNSRIRGNLEFVNSGGAVEICEAKNKVGCAECGIGEEFRGVFFFGVRFWEV